jgi:hypothetical protein
VILILHLLPLEPWGAKHAGCGRGTVIFASVTFSLQFAKASAATLLQQEKNDSADTQRGGLNISGIICRVAS